MAERSLQNKGDTTATRAPLQGALERIDHELRDMERRMDALFADLPIDWERFGQLVHGWSVVPGARGVPFMERFGNIGQTIEALTEGWRRPFLNYNIDEDAGRVTVTAEMPGVQKDDIDVRVTGESIDIEAKTGDRRYRGRLTIGVPLDAQGAEAEYDQGVLTLRVGTVTPSEKAGQKIRIR